MRDHKDFIIDTLIDGIAEAFAQACCDKGIADEIAGIGCLRDFTFIENYISSLPGESEFIEKVYDDFLKNFTEQEAICKFRNFFRTQIKMHIREEIRAMGDGKIGGDVSGY